MAVKSPPTPRQVPATTQQRQMMNRYGGNTQQWTLRKAFTPQLGLNLGMDRRGDRDRAEFNGDFNNDFAIGEGDAPVTTGGFSSGFSSGF